MGLGSVWRSVARSFASALAIEVVSPKISGVTASEALKGMSSPRFIHTSLYVYDAVLGLPTYEGCAPIGKTLLSLVSSTLENPVVGTNTCLGYGLTAISLASSILYSLREGACGDPGECALAGYGRFEECAREERPDHLLKSIELANPSYHGRYYSPRASGSVFELLLESAPWDLVAYNVVSRFSATLDLYSLARSVSVDELVEAVGRLYRYAASRYADSIAFKSGGLMLSRLVREIASSSRVVDADARRILVGELGVNLGSVSDVVGSALALVLLRREWVDRHDAGYLEDI